MSKNLWPDFNVDHTPRSPRSILEEAGSGLEEKTSGLVQFYVGTPSVKDNKMEIPASLYVPSLPYFYPFLRVIFAIDSFYPLRIVADKIEEIVANSENELIDSLGRILSADSTRESIERLISISK